MKKLWAIGLTAAVLLAGCGEEESAESKETTAGAEGSEDSKEVKQELMKFYMSIPNTINAVDADLNAFEMNQAEDTLPEGEELQAMKAAAIASAEEAANAVETVEIPAALEEQQEKFDTAFAAMIESYEMKAEELTKDASFEAADEKFGEADAILNELLVEQDLAASSIYNEVSQ
ncbi:hypothetical protein BBH88_15370 [Planococcus antarcticus DSM 14505]|uniref:Lipoprotein n=1 Tax=Planococcus antarcticus DSM 14505 TaxID=1185653 RepID=A0ABM6D824_9BACL|nr:hypothetical protein [Planococcus antarcticus]ANU11556.1 hypothetical protein BBH88_15370 [Planococcus antarcticus DSM 14505]